ncbi:MAG: ubiquitin-like domain-containing protein [Anaerolineales bacterium]
MRRAVPLVLPILFFLISCQPQTNQAITIIDGDQIHQLVTSERVPASLLTQAGIQLGTSDIVLLNGQAVAVNQPMPTEQTYTLQVLRAINIMVNGKTIQTTAQTVGEALSQSGAQIYAADKIDPPADTPITASTKVTYTPSKELTISVDGKQIQIRSSAATVGGALAEAGIPLLGLDSSQPSENEALPSNGQIQVTRVSESILLSEKFIPFKTDYQQSADVELDQQKTIQPGQLGLSVSRVRIIYNNGQEVSRQNDSETVVRVPQDEIVGYGTKVVIHTATVNGVQIQYWRAVQMYATSYSPCRSGGTKCYSGTSSGQPVQKGEVAVKYSWYLTMEGQKLFIPGYGFATIEDVCGGCVGKPWVDLGYSDSDYQGWGQTVTVYFLAPAPASIPSLN